MFDQGDIDREFAIAGDKFLGAIERIDKNEAFAALGRVSVGDGFLGDDRNIGKRRCEPLKDQRFGRRIGFGQGRRIGLGRYLELAAVDRKDQGAGLKGDGIENIADIAHPIKRSGSRSGRGRHLLNS